MTPLSQARLKEVLHYDASTGTFVWRKREGGARGIATFNAQFAGKSAGNYSKYVDIRVDGRLYRAHRLAWLYCHGTLPPLIDHKNSDRYDNRLDNLRVADKQTNGANRTESSNNKLGRKGINWNPRRNAFEWSVKRGLTRVRGRTKTLEDAVAAQHCASLKLYGEFTPRL